MATQKVKPFWKSTTLWINVVGFVSIVLTMVAESGIVNDTEIVALVVAVANFLNRFRKVEKVDLSLK